jgi:hypothetical protein
MSCTVEYPLQNHVLTPPQPPLSAGAKRGGKLDYNDIAPFLAKQGRGPDSYREGDGYM